ncbi:MAG: UbiA prenyltransferase family protein [Thermoplasmata archaeon]|nr:UbiA prenyltransferase family protein [Thermoplasmata archaeon]
MCAKIYPKDPWEKAEYVPVRIRALIDLVRPFTLLPPLIGGMAGAIMALAKEGTLESISFTGTYPFITLSRPVLYPLLTGVSALVFMNAASNVLNQVYDIDIDRINKPYRPLPSGIYTREETLWIAVFLYLFSFWRAAIVGRTFFFMILLIALFTIIYSVPPLRLKKRLWISNISIALPRGMLGIVASWCIFGNITDPTPWAIGAVMAIYLVGSTTTKDLTDVEGDRKYGVRTLPVVYGKKKAIYLSLPFFLLPSLATLFFVQKGLLPDKAFYLGLILLPWGTWVAYLLAREGDRPDEHFENSPAWRHMYIMLMGMQVGFLFSLL